MISLGFGHTYVLHIKTKGNWFCTLCALFLQTIFVILQSIFVFALEFQQSQPIAPDRIVEDAIWTLQIPGNACSPYNYRMQACWIPVQHFTYPSSTKICHFVEDHNNFLSVYDNCPVRYPTFSKSLSMLAQAVASSMQQHSVQEICVKCQFLCESKASSRVWLQTLCHSGVSFSIKISLGFETLIVVPKLFWPFDVSKNV